MWINVFKLRSEEAIALMELAFTYSGPEAQQENLFYLAFFYVCLFVFVIKEHIKLLTYFLP